MWSHRYEGNLIPSYLLLCVIVQFDWVLLTVVCYCTAWFLPTYCCVLLYNLIVSNLLLCYCTIWSCYFYYDLLLHYLIVLLTAVCYCTICFHPTYCCVIVEFDSVLFTAVCYCTIRFCLTSYTWDQGDCKNLQWLLCRAHKAGMGGEHSRKRSAGKHNDCYAVRIRRGYEKRTVQNVVQQENSRQRVSEASEKITWFKSQSQREAICSEKDVMTTMVSTWRVGTA